MPSAGSRLVRLRLRVSRESDESPDSLLPTISKAAKRFERNGRDVMFVTKLRAAW